MQLPVLHWRQRRQGECLAACAAMVLAYLGKRVNYDRLVQQLDTSDAGAFFSNIDRLRSLQLTVERRRGSLTVLQTHLENNYPVIVPVDTALLPYWITRPDLSDAERVTNHAVLVVGIDDQHIYLNDPDLELVPQVVALDWFTEAWRSHDYWYAVVHRRWQWRRKHD